MKNRVESLTASLIAWKQFESGINEFKEALGKDETHLKRITGELELGTNVVTNNLAGDVKEVAKRLSEKMENQNSITLQTVQQVIFKFYLMEFFKKEKSIRYNSIRFVGKMLPDFKN